mgnify:CR=1 FL=1
MAKASKYLSLMDKTANIRLQLGDSTANVEAVLTSDEVVPTERWSSGMGDQVYLLLAPQLGQRVCTARGTLRLFWMTFCCASMKVDKMRP